MRSHLPIFCLNSWVNGVLFRKFLPDSYLGRYPLCFLLEISAFQVSPWGIGFIWSWFLCKVIDTGLSSFYYTCGHPVFPVLFVEDAVFPPVCSFWHFCPVGEGRDYGHSGLGLLFSSSGLPVSFWSSTMLVFFLQLCNIAWTMTAILLALFAFFRLLWLSRVFHGFMWVLGLFFYFCEERHDFDWD